MFRDIVDILDKGRWRYQAGRPQRRFMDAVQTVGVTEADDPL